VSKVDLHVHTTASDGQYTPAEVVRLAAAQGLGAVGITDHDTVAGLPAALAAAAQVRAIEVVPGVEMSTETWRGEVHVLGYYVDWEDAGLLELLDRLRNARRTRAQQMVERLAGLGIHVPWQHVADLAGDGAYGRPHIARAMVELGYVPSTADAFAQYIGYNGPAYVARYKLTPAEAVLAILAASGVPVLAHPWGLEDLEGLVTDLVATGLAGIEAYYRGYTPSATRELVGLARKYGLIVTGGSDFHGTSAPDEVGLGGVDVPGWTVEELQRVRKTRSRREPATLTASGRSDLDYDNRT